MGGICALVCVFFSAQPEKVMPGGGCTLSAWFGMVFCVCVIYPCSVIYLVVRRSWVEGKRQIEKRKID